MNCDLHEEKFIVDWEGACEIHGHLKKSHG